MVPHPSAVSLLLSSEAEPLLALAREFAGSPLELIERLRRETSPDRAAAVAEQAALQIRARAKFAQADRMRFTRHALEASTGERIARYRAERFRGLPTVDLTCGIGGDLLALARVTSAVGVDRDPLRLLFARHNLAVHGLDAGLLQADVSRWFPRGRGYFLDPSRRATGRRLTQLTHLEPDISLVEELLRRSSAIGVKLSPALDYRNLPWEAEVEVISDRGECKEVVLWLGELRSARVRATVLPAGVTLVADDVPEAPVAPPRAYLLEPDPAVIRAHLVDTLAAHLDAAKLDPEIAYLTAGCPVQTPFATAYRVVEARPFSLKELRSRLRSLGYGRVVVKKRGVVYDPAEIARRLRLPGAGPEAVVVLTRLAGKSWALICDPAA